MNYCFIRNPWDAIGMILNRDRWIDHTELDHFNSWPSFLLSEEDVYIQPIAALEPFPSRLVKMDGLVCRVTELPGPALNGDKAFKDTFEIRKGNGSQSEAVINYRLLTEVEDKNTSSESGDFESFFDQILDEIIFIVRNGLNVERSISNLI